MSSRAGGHHLPGIVGIRLAGLGPDRRALLAAAIGAPPGRCTIGAFIRTPAITSARAASRATIATIGAPAIRAPRPALTAPPRFLAIARRDAVFHQPEIDAPCLQVDGRDLHLHLVGQGVAAPGALAHQHVTAIVEAEVFVAQLGHVHHAFDVEVVEGDEDAKGCHAGDVAVEDLADPVAHVDALEPGLHVAGGLVGPALVGRADLSQGFPGGVGFGLGHLLAAARTWRQSGRRGGGRPRAGGIVTLRLVLLRLDHRQVAALVEQRLDRPVVEQVGIAADRRGEVRVGIIGQAEVSLVVRRVDGLLHRAQHHRLQQRGIGPTTDLLRQQLVILRARTPLLAGLGRGIAQHQTGAAEKLAQLGQPVGAGAFVHAVEGRMMIAPQKIGCAGVGRQHAFLDQAVRIVAALGDDLGDPALLVAEHFGLGGLEFDRAAALPGLQQGLVECIQIGDLAQQRRAPLDGRQIVARQDAPDLVIGQPCGRVHHRRIELVGRHVTIRMHDHVGHQHQPVDLGVDRAQPVGEFLGQHRDHAARKVHRGRALLGLAVERAAGPHVMADIGDRHQQPPAGYRLAGLVAQRLAIDGIVEIAGIRPVDRHQRHVAQVDPHPVVGRPQCIGQRLGLGQNFVTKLVWHLELAHGDLDLHARITHAAQHLAHAADGRRVPVGRREDLHRHHLARLRPQRAARLDQHVVLDALVLGHQHQRAGFFHQAAHHRALVALGHLDDLALGSPAVVGAHAAHQHPVAMHHLAHLARRQEDVVATGIRQQKAEAVTMTGHLAGHQVDAAHQHQVTLAPLQDLAVALHGSHATTHAHHRLGRHLHLQHQFIDAQWGALGSQRIQNRLPAGGIRKFFGH